MKKPWKKIEKLEYFEKCFGIIDNASERYFPLEEGMQISYIQQCLTAWFMEFSIPNTETGEYFDYLINSAGYERKYIEKIMVGFEEIKFV